jgi:hypothetical protein
MNLHREEILDLNAKQQNNMCWDEMADVGLALKSIISDLKTFEEAFDNNFYSSNKPAMSDQWDRLNSMLAEFKDEVVYTEKNVCSYYK